MKKYMNPFKFEKFLAYLFQKFDIDTNSVKKRIVKLQKSGRFFKVFSIVAIQFEWLVRITSLMIVTAVNHEKICL